MAQDTISYLQSLAQHLANVNIETKLLMDDTGSDVHTLLADIENDYKDRQQYIGLTYIDELITEKEEDLPLIMLQYFVEFEPEIKGPEVYEMITYLNARMPIGHLGIQNGKVHLRYVLTDIEINDSHIVRAIQTFFVFVDVLDIFQEPVEQYLLNEASFEVIKNNF